MRNPLLSVIIPAFNCEQTIIGTLDSIRQQSFTNLQVIIVNDGSFDNSEEVIRDYIETDSRFILITKANGGVSCARNVGLDYAKGDYVTFSDSDDYVLPGAYEFLVNTAEREQCDIVVADYLKGSKVNANIVTHDTSITNPRIFISHLLRGKVHGSLWNKLFKMNLFKKHRFVEGINFMEDMLLLINYLLVNNTSIYVATGFPVYHYILNNNSYTNSLSKEYLRIGDEVVRQLSCILPSEVYKDDLLYLKSNQKLLYLLNCNTNEVVIRDVFPEVNGFIRKMDLPIKYKMLLLFENFGISLFTDVFKYLKSKKR